MTWDYIYLLVSYFSAIIQKGDNFQDFLFASLSNIVLAETLLHLTLLHSEWSFGHSECNRVKGKFLLQKESLKNVAKGGRSEDGRVVPP